MFQRVRNAVPRGLLFLAFCVPAWAVGLAGPVHASDIPTGDVILYRVFLLDGTNAVSYGEFARIAGTVVFSMPLGGLGTEAPKLQLVSLSESAVDWPRTEAYAEAARAKRFVETRAETEFSRLSEAVATTLSQVALTADPAKRLAIADRARRMLADWPAHNYAYRAGDVSQLAALLDEVVSELRVAAGQSRFELTLVASASPPPAVPMMPEPTLRESVEQAFMLAARVGRRNTADVAPPRDHRSAGGARGRGWLGRRPPSPRHIRAHYLDAHGSHLLGSVHAHAQDGGRAGSTR